MNRILLLALGLLILSSLGYWYYDQTERRQRSAEAMRVELGEFLSAQGARYGSLTYDRKTRTVTVTQVAWTQEADGMERRVTLEQAQIVAGDIEAFRKIFNPASYAPGDARVGEQLRLAAAIELRGLEVKQAAGTVILGRLRLEAPSLRQFGFTPTRQGLSEAGLAFIIGDVGNALKLQKGRLENLHVTRTDGTEFTLATLDLGPFDAGKLAQLAANGMSYKATGVAAELNGLAVNGLVLKSWLDAIRDGQLTLAQGWFSASAWDGNYSPTFDGVKIVDFRMVEDEARPRLAIDEASLTELVRVGEFVAAGTLRIAGLEFPVRGESPWSKALRSMGYETLRINVESRSTYDPKTKVSEMAELSVEVENLGRLHGSSRLENVEIGDELRELDMQGLLSGGLNKILNTWKLASLEVGYKDLSLIQRAFALALKRHGKTTDELIDEYTSQLDELRTQYGDGPFLTQLSEQMKVFLEEPNSIVFRMVPPEPVLLAQIAVTGFNNPEEMAKMLGLTVTANSTD